MGLSVKPISSSVITCAAQRMRTAGFIPRAWALSSFTLGVGLMHPGITPAMAQGAEHRPGTTQALADAVAEPSGYRELIEEALSEYEMRHFEEARALFRRAHDLFPNARTSRGQGMSEFELRNYGGAIQCFESALSAKVRPLDGTLRRETERLLNRARRFVSRLRLHLLPAEATVRVDGELVQVEPDGTLLLAMGTHTLEFRADAHRPEHHTVSVRGGEETVLDVALVGLSPRSRSAGAVGPESRRVAGGVHLSALAGLEGYARNVPGLGLDGSVWLERSRWVVDLRLGLRSDVTEPQRDYFHIPLEVSAERLVPIAGHAFVLGAGTGVTYLHESVELTQTIGHFAVTRAHYRIKDSTIGVPLLARAGLLFSRVSSVSVLASCDYSLTFANLKHGFREQALRLHIGLLFGRSRP